MTKQNEAQQVARERKRVTKWATKVAILDHFKAILGVFLWKKKKVEQERLEMKMSQKLAKGLMRRVYARAPICIRKRMKGIN